MKPRNWLGLSMLLFAVLRLGAATNSDGTGEILALKPPHPELPPTLWDQHGAWIMVAAVVLFALGAFVVWWWLRPRPPLMLPVEVQARQELEALQRRSEDGKALSQVSRVLRRYLAAAFELPPEELTTTEFCRVLADREKVGSELAVAAGEFLRRCDEHKFAPSIPPTMGAAARALALVELGEARRGQLRLMAVASDPGQPAKSA